jgi:hypothetical protein
MCDSGRDGAWGERPAKDHLARVVDGPVPIHALPRPRYRSSSRRNTPPSLDFPIPPRDGEREEVHRCTWCLAGAPPSWLGFLMSVSVCFQDLYDRAKSARTLPQWFALLGGRLYKQSAIAITLGTLSEVACR